MIHLRPQRVYKPSTCSGNPNNSIANYLDRYYNQGLYRLRLETPRGTSLTEDNSQITCYAHVFNNTDGSEVTDRLKGRGFRPTWLLDGKSIDSVCISEEGYLLTLDSAHLTDYTQTVTLQALDTEILSALSEEPQFDLWLQQTLKGQGIQPTLLKQSETLINMGLVNKKRDERIDKLLEELSSHPLTVSKDGYWRIWDALKKTYITTEYKSKGDKGEPGHNPSPDEVLGTDRFKNLLEVKVTDKVKPVEDEVAEAKKIATRGYELADQNYDDLAQAKTDLGRDINNLYSVTNGMTGDLEALDTGVSNALDKADMAERAAVDVSGRLDSFKTSANTNITNANTYIDNAFTYIGDIVHTLDSSRRYSISSSGRVSSHVSKTCSTVQKDLPSSWRSLCQPPPVEPEIRLVLYSDYESLRAQVMTLTSKLAQLEATTTVTPVTNAYNRAKKGHFGQVTDSLYPLYGDWLLTSDAKEQKIYFSGLRAEIGRSIYIQTRKKAYLNANGHSFYGLPSVSENQWLSNNTTYRFVRASDTAWLVTASSSPYPWT